MIFSPAVGFFCLYFIGGTMAYSMTGFGRGEKIFDTRRYSVEIKSVNSRFCDINVRMPRLFNFAEAAVRKQINDTLGRGKVDVFINFEDSQSSGSEVVLNEGLIQAYSKAVSRTAEITGRTDDMSASRLTYFPDVINVRQKSVDEDVMGDELAECVTLALNEMLKMRKREGDNLASDITDKVCELEKIRDEIASRAPSVVEDYRKRLSDRIDEILDDSKREFYDEGRLAAEVALFADKCAIDEELKRLRSHFDQAHRIMAFDGNIGKKMDFLIQEINREINTIGSKANDIEITNRVLASKNLVEEMREQIQNLV